MPKKVFIIIGLVIIITGCAYAYWQYQKNNAKDELVISGNVDIRQVDLAFRVGGRITEVLVDEGDKVEKGQPLAKLERDLLTQQLVQAQAHLQVQKANLEKLQKGYRVQEIAQANASVAAANASAENAQLNLERVQHLYNSKAASQRDLDNALASEREARAELHSAQENLSMLLSGYREEEVAAQEGALIAAQAQLKKAEIELSDGVLLAPQDGIVLSRAREAGAIVDEGQTVYTISLNNPLWLKAYISEQDRGKIKPGMAVEAAVDYAPDKRFPGTVGFISPTREFIPKTVGTKEQRPSLMYRFKVQVEDPENIMRQGMPVSIFINTAPH